MWKKDALLFHCECETAGHLSPLCKFINIGGHVGSDVTIVFILNACIVIIQKLYITRVSNPGYGV